MGTNPVIIVTGAANGIGLEIVRYLLEELDGRVVAVDIVQGGLNQLVATHAERLEVVIGDVTNEQVSVKAVGLAVDRFGRLTGVCLNAGMFGPCHRLSDSDPAKWNKAFQVNVLSHLYTQRFPRHTNVFAQQLRHAIPLLRQNQGRVVFTTSAAGDRAFFAGWGFYGMSKAAVAFTVKQLHLEEPSLTVVGLAPGYCDTNMVRGLRDGTWGADDGWSKEDADGYLKAFEGIEMVSPRTTGMAYACTVTRAPHELSGSVLEYSEPQIQALVG